MFDVPGLGLLWSVVSGDDNSDEGDDDEEFELHLPEGREIETLRITREESRASLDHQLNILADVDDKAMRTVRITLLTIGILASATALEIEPTYVNSFSITGGMSLVASIITGLIAYSASDVESGIGRGYYDDVLQADYTEEEWLEVIIAGYDEWLESTTRSLEFSATALSVTEFFVGMGVILLGLGILLPYHGII